MAGDAEDLFEYLSNEDVVKYEPYDVFTLEGCVKEAERRAADPAFWAVCLREGQEDSGKLVGNIYLTERDYSGWELGYVLNPKYQRRGFASEAVTALIDYAVFEKKAHRLYAMCNPENIRSWHLLERIGMRREAHYIKDIYFRLNDWGMPVWQDTYVYAILADEWKNLSL